MAVKLNQHSVTPQQSVVKRNAGAPKPQVEKKSIVTPGEYSPLKSRKKSDDLESDLDLDEDENEDDENDDEDDEDRKKGEK